MDYRKVLQVADMYQTRDDANDALEWQRTQVGYIAGRVVDVRAKDGRWLMQSFHECDADIPCGDIGECARVVLAPPWMST